MLIIFVMHTDLDMACYSYVGRFAGITSFGVVTIGISAGDAENVMQYKNQRGI